MTIDSKIGACPLLDEPQAAETCFQTPNIQLVRGHKLNHAFHIYSLLGFSIKKGALLCMVNR